MTKQQRTGLFYFLVAVAVILILIGTFSFFTDRLSSNATITTVGGDGQPAVDIVTKPDITVTPDDPTLPPFEDPTPDNTLDDLENWWKYVNSKTLSTFAPGDKITLNFNMTNEGALAVDVRETFILTSSKPLSQTPEFRLFTSVTEDNNGAFTGEEVLLKEEKIDDTHYKYTITPYTISSADEVIDGNDATEVKKEYYLVFNKNTANEFQASSCQIDYIAEAKQHSKGGETDWIIASTAQITAGGQNLNVVPKN